ncbi:MULTISPECIES: hypothetical protein [unclassified Prochlorococcus]|uniref:hypothetical protein n=1 Tax=unclassified Prochlorococcus TaxID=2627481 RepID=UPI0012685A43|nr:MULTISPECIES: hypothetical protein [unclassified Prochlorococcus]
MRFIIIGLQLFSFSSFTPPVLSRSYPFQGKCGILMIEAYQEKCKALFSEDILTIIPKGSRQIRILPQQIVSFSLANKATMKINERDPLWKNSFNRGRFWWKNSATPEWVIKASQRRELHQFLISYVDRSFNPQLVLFVLDDPTKAGSMSIALNNMSGLNLNQTRKPGDALSSQISYRMIKKAKRQAKRLKGLCNASMYDDAKPVAIALDSYVNNTINEISIFSGSERTIEDLQNIVDGVISNCDGKRQEDIALERKEKEAAEEAKTKAEAEKRKAAFDMLGSY